MDYSSLLLGPIYGVLGVPATITGTGVAADLTAIDKTAGVLVGTPIEVGTLVPAAAVRASELASLGLAVALLDDCHIALNGVTWRIASTKPKPSPGGEADGEYWLLLEGL
jgi:hypothetical protein